jgi:hypothetical protein
MLTILWQARAMFRVLALPLVLLLAACADEARAPTDDAALIAADPVIARALHDPLMSDPDLAMRNGANAILGFADSGALPVLAATPEAARSAREQARLALLADGPLPDLPPPLTTPRGKPLGPMASGADLIAALGAPASCAARLTEDFALAADLPPVAAILPQGMVVQAGGADVGPCRLRIIRYQTPAAIEDVLHYHYILAGRAGLAPARHNQPEDLIAATNTSGEALVVHARPGPHGLTAVDLLYRAP